VDVYSLSFHARYRCRHSGVCCSSGWPIPVEADRLSRIQAAIASGALRTPAPNTAAIASAESTHAPAILSVVGRRCVFYSPGQGGSCAVHNALGHEALPLACRQFPRVSVLDPRGASVTLSHYCPTAAGLLEDGGAAAIEINGAAFPAGGEYVGLEARDALPPLLCRDVLMDWKAWWALEAAAVGILANAHGSPAESLVRLARAVADLQTWRPGGELLIDRVQEACARQAAGHVEPMDVSATMRDQTVDRVLAAMPDDVRPPDARVIRPTRTSDDVARRFLAAHAFANWAIHLGDGLTAWIRSIETAWVLLDAGLDVRTADLWLRHLADPAALV